MKIQFRSLTLLLLAAVLIPSTPSLATTTNSPLHQTLTPSTTKLAISKELRNYAQKITVRVTSANNGGSGVLVARKGNTYLVLTNQHVTRRDRQFKIATADGKQHTATLLPNTNIDPKYDLALLQFTSTSSYELADLKDGSPLELGQIYSAGYPYDSDRLRFSGGNISQISDIPLEDGTQVGYVINANEKGVRQGMSGGPILDTRGVLVGINTISVAPLSPSYTYVDGSKPTAKKSAQYQQANWGVPIYNLLTQLNPNILYAYDNFPKVPNQVTPTGYMAKLNRDTRQQTVRIETREGGDPNGSGVIVAREGNTYSVLTNEHVVQMKTKNNTKELFSNIKIITSDQESYQIDPKSITIAQGQDLAVVKFTSTANYPVAQLSSVKPRPDDVVFVGGYPGRDKINSPLWQWQLNPGTSYGQDLGQKNTRNNESFTEGYNLVYTNITYGGMSGGPIFDTQGRVIGLHGRAEEGDTPPKLMLGNSLGISIKSFIASAKRLKINPQLLKISRDVPRYLTATELKTVTDVQDSLPQPDSNVDGTQWMKYGGQLNRTRQYKKAVAAFDRAIAIDPKTYLLTGTYGKARAYGSLGNLDVKLDVTLENEDRKLDNLNRAVALYANAIAIVPPTDRKNNYFLWNQQAQNLFKLRKYDEALQSNQQAINLNPTDRILYINRALYYKFKGEYTQAIAIYDRLIQQQPDVAAFYTERGSARDDIATSQKLLGDPATVARNYREAILDFNIALKLDPEYTEAYYLRSETKRSFQDFKGALIDINMAISYDSKGFQYYVTRGLIKIALKDYQGATSDCDLVIAINPKFYSAYSNRGTIKSRLKDYQGAIADYNQAIAINPKDGDTYSVRGVAKMELKDYQGAIVDFTQAIAINQKYSGIFKIQGGDYNVYILRGNAKRELKDYQGAIADHTRAIAIAPKKGAAYSDRGLTKYLLKDYQGTISDFTQSIALNPKNQGDYLMRGDAKNALKDYQGAISDYTQEISLYPKDDHAYRSRGVAKSNLKDYQGSITDYNQAIAINPKSDLSYNLRGIAKDSLKDYTGAISDFTQSIAINPKNKYTYSSRGTARSGLKDYQGAVADYTQAISLDPKDPRFYNLRGTAKSRLKNYQGAIADYNQAISLDPKDPTLYTLRGANKFFLKNYQGAIADYNRAINLNPKDFITYSLRGDAKAKLEDYQGAIADLNQVISLNSKNDNTYNDRGVYKFLTNDNRSALADWEQAMTLNPQNAYAYSNRGLLRIISGDRQTGLADIERSIKLNPNLANNYAYRGLLRAESGDRSDAISDYKQALKLNPPIVDELTKEAKQIQRVNNLPAYQIYQKIIQGLTAQK